MKFDIFVSNTRLDSWTDALISLDEQFSASAQFSVHSPGVGPWLNNLSKVRITGRAVRAETGMWGFESAAGIEDWHLTAGLTSNGIDYTQSAYGAGSWSMTWTAPATLVEIAQQSAGVNLHGMVFWGWVHLVFLQAGFTPQMKLQAFASDGSNEWSSTLLVLTAAAAAGWTSLGLRVIPTSAVPAYPTHVTRWGFRLQFPDAIPAALAGKPIMALNLDSIHLCGRPYGAGLSMPPFNTLAPPIGSLAPWVPLDCARWDEFAWGDELHVAAGDPGWCVQGITWGNFKWALATDPKPNDPQWG